MECDVPHREEIQLDRVSSRDLGITRRILVVPWPWLSPTNRLLCAVELHGFCSRPGCFLSATVFVGGREGEEKGVSGEWTKVVLHSLQHLHTDLGPLKPIAGQ